MTAATTKKSSLLGDRTPERRNSTEKKNTSKRRPSKFIGVPHKHSLTDEVRKTLQDGLSKARSRPNSPPSAECQYSQQPFTKITVSDMDAHRSSDASTCGETSPPLSIKNSDFVPNTIAHTRTGRNLGHSLSSNRSLRRESVMRGSMFAPATPDHSNHDSSSDSNSWNSVDSSTTGSVRLAEFETSSASSASSQSALWQFGQRMSTQAALLAWTLTINCLTNPALFGVRLVLRCWSWVWLNLLGNQRQQLRDFYFGRRCVVTSADHDIGFATVKQLVKLRANVLAVVNDPGHSKASKNLSKLVALEEGSPNIAVMAIDMLQHDTAEEIVEACSNALGGIDLIVVHCTTGEERAMPFLVNSAAKMRDNYQQSWMLPLLLARNVLPILIQQRKGGDLVLTSSFDDWTSLSSLARREQILLEKDSKSARMNTAVAAATQGGMVAFAAALRHEFAATRARICAVHPFVLAKQRPASAKNDHASRSTAERALSLLTDQFTQTPKDVAEAFLWGVVDKQTEVYVGPLAWTVALLERFIPQQLRRWSVFPQTKSHRIARWAGTPSQESIPEE